MCMSVFTPVISYGAPNQSIFHLYLFDQVNFLYGQFDFLNGRLFTFYMVNLSFNVVNFFF